MSKCPAVVLASHLLVSSWLTSRGGHQSCSPDSTTKQRDFYSAGISHFHRATKKELCSNGSNTKKIAKPAEEETSVAATTATTTTTVASRSSSGGLIVAMKKKKRIDDEILVGDPSLEDAALALKELSCLNPHRQGRSSALPCSKSCEQPSGRQSLPATTLPQWTIRKLRSGRTKLPESSSNEEYSHDALATDSSSPSPLLLQKQQFSECSSSPCGDSQSVITLVKVEDDHLCSSTRVEEEEQVEQHKVEVAVVEEQEDDDDDHDNRCPNGPERLPKLLTSVSSSIESLLPDSRAESPSSPLPVVLQKCDFASICVEPKFEGSPAGQSAFQRVVPIRPVKKPTLSRKLKIEEKTFEDLNPEQAAVKHVSRKKPRPTGIVPQPQNQPQQQLAPVKIEDADPFCGLVLGPPRPSAAEEVEVKNVGVTSSIAPAALVVDEKTLKLEPVDIKLETKLSGKLGQRAASKPKPALSESEKEARKQRRVQANRESARLTIRRKQVLCEELSRKSQVLSTENDAFRKEVERMHLEVKRISEMNAKVREQIGKASGQQEPGSSSPVPASMAKAPDGMVHYQFPPQFGGLPMPPQYWAFAMMAQVQAQAAQAGVQPSEINISAEYTNAIFAAAAAATAATCANNPQAGFWNVPSSSGQGQSSMLPPFYPGASMASALTSCGTPATISPITRSLSLPVGPTSSFPMAASSERALPSGRPVASYRSGDFADSVHLSSDLKRNAMKQDGAHQGSGLIGKTHYFQMAPGSSQTGMAATGVGSMVTRKSEGNCLPMSKGPGQPLSRSHSLSTVSKLHSRYAMFGSGVMSMSQEQPTARESEAQRAAAAATEARRKRIELKRSKSFSSRQRWAPSGRYRHIHGRNAPHKFDDLETESDVGKRPEANPLL